MYLSCHTFRQVISRLLSRASSVLHLTLTIGLASSLTWTVAVYGDGCSKLLLDDGAVFPYQQAPMLLHAASAVTASTSMDTVLYCWAVSHMELGCSMCACACAIL